MLILDIFIVLCLIPININSKDGRTYKSPYTKGSQRNFEEVNQEILHPFENILIFFPVFL